MHNTSEFVTLTGAAEMLGFHVRTIRRHIDSGDLPAYRLGCAGARSILIRRADLENLLQPIASTGKRA